MRLASVVVTRSVTWCGLPKAGSCSRRTCSATAAYSGDSRRSVRIARDDLMHYGGAHPGAGRGALAARADVGRALWIAGNGVTEPRRVSSPPTWPAIRRSSGTNDARDHHL